MGLVLDGKGFYWWGGGGCLRDMLRRKVLIPLLVVCLALMSCMPVRADWVFVTRTFDATVVVSDNSYYYVYSYREEGFKVEVDFECVSGGDRAVTYFVCDQASFDLWTSGDGSSASAYNVVEDVVTYSGDFVFPHSDTWYHVFVNYDPLDTRSVKITVDLYEWEAPTTPSNPFNNASLWFNYFLMLAGVSAIILAVVVVTVVVVHQKRKADETAPVPVETRPMVCPICQSPLLESSDQFCSQCGARV